jgi:hypothetical protein
MIGRKMGEAIRGASVQRLISNAPTTNPELLAGCDPY